MKMGKRGKVWGAVAVFVGTVWMTPATGSSSGTDDRDLSPRKLGILADVPLELAPDQQSHAAGDGLAIRVVREDHGREVPVSGLTFAARNARVSAAPTDAEGWTRLDRACQAGETRLSLVASLENDQFSVTNGNDSYRIVADVACSGVVTLRFQYGTPAGQALGIWQIGEKARRKLAASIGPDFWTNRIPFVWPESADYYSWGSVHISEGHHWDVVGHELGHAIYDMARMGRMGGGQHRIDECYTATLALSEGWASYFSAWLSIDLKDADARFEFMVPRRAPIRIEHIPADVCKGEKNEWRVSGFFWDLIDLNEDGETAGEAFARVWRAIAGSRIGSAGEAVTLLERAGMNRPMLDLLWRLNFD